MSEKTCPVSGKRCFVRASSAMKAAARWLKFNPPSLTQTAQAVYRCRHCGRWHLTSWDTARVRERSQALRELQQRRAHA